MAEASIDIRIFQNKELLAVDMAEILDGYFPQKGVLQGCTVHEINGVLSIDAGRIMVRGRLGVVTAGTIPVPTLAQQETCWLIAVCDLNNPSNPFYFELAPQSEMQQLGLTGGTPDPDFNVLSKVDAAILGYCTVNPATGLVSDWHTMEQGIAKKGNDVYTELRKDFLKDFIIRKSFNTGGTEGRSPVEGTGTINYTYTIPDNEIPAGYKALEVRLATNGGREWWYEFYNCECDFTDSPTNKNVRLRFQRRSGVNGTIWPWITVLFIKDIT